MIQYLITDPKYYTNNPITFKKILTQALTNHKIHIACFRDKISSNNIQLAKIFIDICKNFNIENILINSNIELALTLKATGVHLNSTQFNKIHEAKKHNLFSIVSCHNLEDILLAQKNKIDMVTYSPIFYTPNKGNPKGCKTLNNIIDRVSVPVIALGGIITQNHINEIAKTKAIGFASIRYFINNKNT